jgi:hypothetical protein
LSVLVVAVIAGAVFSKEQIRNQKSCPTDEGYLVQKRRKFRNLKRRIPGNSEDRDL